MMKDIHVVSRYIDPLINKYFFVAFIMRDNNVWQRPFVYSVGVFLNFPNLLHVKHINLLLEHTTVFTIPIPLVLYHIPHLVVPPEAITCLLYDSVIHSFCSWLVSWSGGIVKQYILETIKLYYRVASYIPCGSLVRLANLSHFYHLIHRIYYSRTTISVLISHIKPCAYHVTCFFWWTSILSLL